MRERELKGEVREKRSDGKRKSGERGASVGGPAVEKRQEKRELGLTGLRRAKREEKRERYMMAGVAGKEKKNEGARTKGERGYLMTAGEKGNGGQLRKFLRVDGVGKAKATGFHQGELGKK